MKQVDYIKLNTKGNKEVTFLDYLNCSIQKEINKMDNPENATVKQNKKNDMLVDIKMTISKGKYLTILHALEAYGNGEQEGIHYDIICMLKSAEFKGANGTMIV